MTIAQDVTKPNPGAYWEGFIIDGSAFSAPVYRFTASSDTQVGFGGFGTFLPFPIRGENFEVTSEQPPRPKLYLSNVTKYIQTSLQTYNDYKKAKVTRIRTLGKYLDNGTTPDATQFLPLEVFYVQQLESMDTTQAIFVLNSVIDMPNIKLPLAQVLKDQTGGTHNLYAPGVSAVRFRG